MDDKAWPSLNEAVSEEQKQENILTNVNLKGSTISHDSVRGTDSAADSSEAVCDFFFCGLKNVALRLVK